MPEGLPHPQSPAAQLREKDESEEEGEFRAEDEDGGTRDPDEAAILLEEPAPKRQQS